ncbi:MAG: hypothetical protein ACFFER_16545, partial [Candidatus Thorarchaeota archaeon]
PTAIGWSEIRNALESIEMMRATGLEDARLLLVERCGETSLRVTLQSMDELRDYLGSSLRETILGDVDSGEVCSKQIHTFKELSSHAFRSKEILKKSRGGGLFVPQVH